MAKIKNIENRVKTLLEDRPDCRSDDRLLISVYMARYHNITTFSQYYYAKDTTPSLESIRRCRQKIQANGELQANAIVKQYRSRSRKAWKNYAVHK